MIDMTENDFGVIMRPAISEEDGEWEGDVQVSVFSNHMPEISDDVHSQLMFLAYKMAAMIQFCTDNEEFDDALSDYTEDLVDGLEMADIDDPVISHKEKITNVSGNVITLNFNTKCEGEG
mgnify:CR=1 FL=1|jgi:hypothetical protein